MINFMYGKEDIWTGTTLEEIFEVGTKYNTVELMDIVVAQCRSLPLMSSDVLDAATDAERFQDLFPKAAEAVLENCTSELQRRLTKPEDFIQFASQHSLDQVKSGTVFRLMARLKALPNVIVEKTDKGEQKLQKKMPTFDKIEANISQTCSNCHQVPCLCGQSVRDIKKVVIGCRLLTVKCPTEST